MTPQVVDFNNDGFNDLVMGTFEGVAFMVPGTKDGYSQPVRIKDMDDRSVLISMFWNMETEKWDNADRSPEGESDAKHHCISVVAVDWDHDKDLDLLLGAKSGELYLRRNEGTLESPKFALNNEFVMAGAEKFVVPGGLTAPKLIDWNSDGLFDLACGSFDGKVYLYVNQGEKGKPKFGDPVNLSARCDAADQNSAFSNGPSEGAYVDVVDYDQDGDLDMLVGGYVTSTQKKKLSDAEKDELKVLKIALRDLSLELNKAIADLSKDQKLSTKEFRKVYQEWVKSDEFKELDDKRRTLSKRRYELSPIPKRESFVWLYRRK